MCQILVTNGLYRKDFFEVIFGWDLMFFYGTLLMMKINNNSEIHFTILLGM